MHKGLLRRLYLRKAFATGEVMACVVANGSSLPFGAELVEALRAAVPELASVVLNVNRDKTNVALGKECRTLWGADAIQDQLCGLTFRLSPLSFYQVNHDQAERLYEKAAEYAALTGDEVLLDLYCGTGTIGLSMAKGAKKLLGVEIIPQAVENAKENAARNHIHNAGFLCGDAAQAAAELERSGERPHVVVIDPPRKGCSPDLVRTIAAMAPRRVVYVSCDPATLARDLKLFAQLGYPPVEATPVDMFPGTAHVETVALLSRQAAEQRR